MAINGNEEDWKKYKDAVKDRVKKSQDEYYHKSKKQKTIVDSSKYVVLDVETNGRSSLNDDLLFVAIYKPDDKKTFEKFFPLHLNNKIKTFEYNGITKKDLKNATHWSQIEFDNLVSEFELETRIILHYGTLDEKFIKNYLKRQKIVGFEKLSFFNFKKNIISSSFVNAVLSKDNLCKSFRIRGVRKTHLGLNDCILEWKLFKKMDNKKIIVDNNSSGIPILYWYNDEYVTPVTHLSNFPNYKYHKCIPKLNLKYEKIRTFEFENLERFENNISGIQIENIIYYFLEAEYTKSHNEDLLFMQKNKGKLKKIFEIEPKEWIRPIPVYFHNLEARTDDPQCQAKIDQINKAHKHFKESNELKKMILYIKKNLFDEKQLWNQELVVNKDDSVLALCDISSKKSILEIKTSSSIESLQDEKKFFEKYKYQLYYQSKGRKIFVMTTEYGCSENLLINFWNVEIEKT